MIGFRFRGTTPRLPETAVGLDATGQARFLLATPNTQFAAPIIIGTGQPVMAMGGFSGRDPILTVEALAKNPLTSYPLSTNVLVC